MGLIIPKEEAQQLQLKENQQMAIEITVVENPLKELFGFGKDNKITKKEFLETRELLEK